MANQIFDHLSNVEKLLVERHFTGQELAANEGGLRGLVIHDLFRKLCNEKENVEMTNAETDIPAALRLPDNGVHAVDGNIDNAALVNRPEMDIPAEHKKAGWLMRRLQALHTMQRCLNRKIFDLSRQTMVVIKEKNARLNSVGGINLNPDNLALVIKVDDDNMPLPIVMQDSIVISIQGLRPVIRGIAPVSPANMPAWADLIGK